MIDYTCDHSSEIASFLFNHALCSCSLQGYDCHQHLHHCLIVNAVLIGLLGFFPLKFWSFVPLCVLQTKHFWMSFSCLLPQVRLCTSSREIESVTSQVFDCCSAGYYSLSEHNYPPKLPRTSEMALWNVMVGRICSMLACSLQCRVMFRALKSITLHLPTWHQRSLVILQLYKPDISTSHQSFTAQMCFLQLFELRCEEEVLCKEGLKEI